MNSKKDDWVSIEEAIKLLMKRDNCSEEVARNTLNQGISDNKVSVNHSGNDPSSIIIITLDHLYEDHGFTHMELAGELRSGRMRARMNPDAKPSPSPIGNCVYYPLLGGYISYYDFGIDGQSLLDWSLNPETPQHLVKKIPSTLIIILLQQLSH